MKHHQVLPKTIQLNKIKIEGTSLAGVGTSLFLPDFKICFDVAQGLPFMMTAKKFFVTHGHLDHASGIPYILSQKAMQNVKGTEFYMPEELVPLMEEVMTAWKKIEQFEYSYNFIGVKSNQTIELGQRHLVKPFSTFHRVPSCGYTLFENKRKIKPEYKGLSSHEIVNLKKQKIEVNEAISDPIFSFTGDAKIEFLDSEPWVKSSKILAMETTYFGETKTIENARQWGHIHLDEILDVIDDIHSEHILLIHLSARHKLSDLQNEIKKKFKKRDVERIKIFPRKFNSNL